MSSGRERIPGRAGIEPCPPESPQKRERVPQDMFDPILRRFVETLAAVRLRYSSELAAFDEDRRRCRRPGARDVATGEPPKTIAADYLVGTDGGASTVREQRRHHHERQRGADLHHQRDVPLRELL